MLIRHGEKPKLGLGQLDCRGLNRALALPKVLIGMFGRPDVIMAPDPAVTKTDNGRDYDYVRPLATIEPTAIAAERPIEAGIGFGDLEALRRALEAPIEGGSVVFVAWEHKQIPALERRLLADHQGDAGQVPDWDAGEFDRIDVITLTQDGAAVRAAFRQAREGLNGQSDRCPEAAPK